MKKVVILLVYRRTLIALTLVSAYNGEDTIIRINEKLTFFPSKNNDFRGMCFIIKHARPRIKTSDLKFMILQAEMFVIDSEK